MIMIIISAQSMNVNDARALFVGAAGGDGGGNGRRQWLTPSPTGRPAGDDHHHHRTRSSSGISQVGVGLVLPIDPPLHQEGQVTNSTDDARYKRPLRVLGARRRKAAITQTDLAKKIRRTQQFVSKYESGERRLDAIEFADICDALRLDRAAVLDEVAPHIRRLARRLPQKSQQS